MTNVISILVDSVWSNAISNMRTNCSSTPFIDTLINDGLFAKNVFSFGPYTDAASNALFTGRPTMDDFGYYYSINSSTYNHYRVFKEAGYETYGFYYPYYLLSSKTVKYIDHTIYTSGFWYQAVWGGKLQYYSDIIKHRNLSEDEIRVIIHFMDMLFDVLFTFYQTLETDHDSYMIISRLKVSENKNCGYELLCKEFKRYNNNKNEYIIQVLNEGMQHNLAKINEYNPDRNTNREFIKEIYNTNRDFFKELDYINKWANLFHGTFDLTASIHSLRSFTKSFNKNDLRFISNEWRSFSAVSEMKNRSLQPYWQYCASMGKQISTLCELLKRRQETKESASFYASIHVLEPHNDISFFSYDMDDKAMISEELDYIKPMIHRIGKNFKGNTVYQASLMYVDLCVKRLISFLNQIGLLENTCILLTSDHGTSYTYNPVRNAVVNTFYNENYNIPMLIWSKRLKPELKKKLNGNYSSADIYPTLCDILEIDFKDKFKGISMLQVPKGREYTLIEYMGPGCPDLISKEMWIAVRNNHYILAYKNAIDKPFDHLHPCEVYCLDDDPNQLENKASSKEILTEEWFLTMSSLACRRFEEVQKESLMIRENIENFKVTQ